MHALLAVSALLVAACSMNVSAAAGSLQRPQRIPHVRSLFSPALRLRPDLGLPAGLCRESEIGRRGGRAPVPRARR